MPDSKDMPAPGLRFPWVSVLTAACLSALFSCSHDSYLKVTLLSADTPFDGVVEINVRVQGGTNGSSSAWLTYHVPASAGLSFDTVMSKTFSIAFTPGQSGEVDLDVGIKDASGCVGRGVKRTALQKGNVSGVTIWVNHTRICPTAPDAGAVDGGDAGGSDAVTFPGCDPGAPQEMCPANQACFVNCFDKRGTCVAAGTKGPGEPCGVNGDECMPGTQCFDYSTVPGCAPGTKICQKFCNGDAQCAFTPGGTGGTGGTLGGGGAGGTAGSRDEVAACRNPVVCDNNVLTTYRTCSFACDPRGEAKLGCSPGLLCFLYREPTSGQDVPDCGCHTPTRTKAEGESCTSSAVCLPGHICNMMSGTQVCRRLCKMGSPGDCVAPRTCGALQNNNVFGVCI